MPVVPAVPGGSAGLRRRDRCPVRTPARHRLDERVEQQEQTEAPCVDDAGLGQHVELRGGALQGLGGGVGRCGRHRHERTGAAGRVRAVGGRVQHADNGALGGAAQRAGDEVCGVPPGAPECGAVDGHGPVEGVGQAPQHLREEDTGVAAGAVERAARQGADDRGDVLGVRRGGVEFGRRGAQGDEQVGTGVAVGDGEDVEAVDLVAALGERPQPEIHPSAQGSPVDCFPDLEHLLPPSPPRNR